MFPASPLWEPQTSHREYRLGYIWYHIATEVIALLEEFVCLRGDVSIPIFDRTNYVSLNFR